MVLEDRKKSRLSVPKRLSGSIILRLLIFALGLSLARAQAPQPDASISKPKSQEIEGSWKGVYFSYPELLVVSLTIRTLPMDRIEGDIEVSPAVPPDCRGCGTHQKGQLKGHYTPWATELSTEPFLITAVLDRKRDQLVGFYGFMGNDNTPALVMARGPAGDVLVKEVVASAYAPVGGGGNRALPSPEKLTNWIAHFREEFATVDVRHTQMQVLWRLLQNLYDDDSFAPVFGTTFDHFGSDQRKEMEVLFRRAPRSELIDEYNFLGSPFGIHHSGGADYMSVWVFRQRAIRSWIKERMEWCTHLPPEFESFVLIKGVESTSKAQLATLWPSEAKKLAGTIAETRSRLASVILERGSEQAVSSASDVAGARILAGWLEGPEQKEIAPYAPADAREKIRARLEAKIGELITSPLQQHEARLANLGEGKEAVLAGNKWYSQLHDQFGFASQRDVFQHALQKLKDRRPADLQTALGAISAELRNQTVMASVDSKMKEYLRVPGDEATPAGTELRSVAQKVRAEIKSNEYLTFFSPNERQWNPQRDGSITIPAVVPAPDGDDIRVAYARTYEMMGGERITPFSFKWGLNPLLSAFGLHVTTVVQPVQSVTCTTDSGGYVCDFRLSLKVEDTGLLADRGTGIGNALQQFFNAVANGPARERFELGNRGWWSPSLRTRISEQMSK